MTALNTLGELRGTMAYVPPEIYDGHLFGTYSDIYSLGITFCVLNDSQRNSFMGNVHKSC